MKPTRMERVRAALADDILTGRLKPGVRLDEAGLAQRFSVSRTPIREALRELAATGLVRGKPHLGAVVAAISDRQVEEIFEAVAELEAVCARLCTLKMSAADRHRLEQNHRACAELVRSGDSERYHLANAAFHAAIRDGSHNAVLGGMVGVLRERFAPLSRAQFRGPGRLAQSYLEHDEIVRAILRGDAAHAYRAAIQHGSSIRRAFVDYAAIHSGVLETQAAK